MGDKIYYKIKHNAGFMELYSGVMTGFGGMAWNYVKSDPFAKELRAWAEQKGWVEFKPNNQ